MLPLEFGDIPRAPRSAGLRVTGTETHQASTLDIRDSAMDGSELLDRLGVLRLDGLLHVGELAVDAFSDSDHSKLLQASVGPTAVGRIGLSRLLS